MLLLFLGIVPFLSHCCIYSLLVHQHPIRVTGSLRTRLLSIGKWTQAFARMNELDADEDLDLYYHRGFYIANITLGRPPQQLQVALDTTYPFFWVIDSQCTNEPCQRAQDWDYKRKGFDANKSSSISGGDPNSTPCVQCLNDTETGPQQKKMTFGRLYWDLLQIGPVQFEGQPFISAEYIEPQWVNFPFDGILGLGWPYRMLLGQKPVLMKLGWPVFTIWVDWRRPKALGGRGGFLTIGGRDNDHCAGPWHDVPLEAFGWQFSITGFKVGKYRSYRSYSAVLDTGTALIGGPHSQINMIIAAANAEYCEENGLYMVPCERISQMDPFVLKINRKDIEIPPEEYVLDLGFTDGKCVLGVFAMYADEFTADWILGDIFIDTFCTMFDYENGKVSLARAKDTVPYGKGEEFNASLHVHRLDKPIGQTCPENSLVMTQKN